MCCKSIPRDGKIQDIEINMSLASTTGSNLQQLFCRMLKGFSYLGSLGVLLLKLCDLRMFFPSNKTSLSINKKTKILLTIELIHDIRYAKKYMKEHVLSK